MNINKQIESKDEARDFAIDYQHWAGNESLSYADLIEWQNRLTVLGEIYGLTAEFEENGII